MKFKKQKGKYKVTSLGVGDIVILILAGVLGWIIGNLIIALLFVIGAYFIEKRYQIKKLEKLKKK